MTTNLGASTYRSAMVLEARRARLTHRTIDVEGLPMGLFTGGPENAPTLVLLHGFSADRTVWIRFAQRFTKDFHVVIPDLAGHGVTPFVAGAAYSGPAQAARVAALLDALGRERVHVLGNSMGGFIGAWFALADPDRTLTLGLCDAVGVQGSEPTAVEQAVTAGGTNPFLMDHPSQFDAFYALTMARPPFVPRFVKAAIAADYVARRDALAEIFEGLFGQDPLDDRLGDLTAPTLVLWGSEDQLVHPSCADAFVAGIPNARKVVYDGIGHMPMLEVPKRSATDYRRFLISPRSRPGS